MSVLRNLEAKLGGIVEGAFGRAFKTSVQPVELAHKLAKEMEENQMVSVSRVYVPNHYRVPVPERPRAVRELRAGAAQGAVRLPARARTPGAPRASPSRPQVEFHTDDRLELGEFGIQAQLLGGPEEDVEPAEAGAVGRGLRAHDGLLARPRGATARARARPPPGLLIAEAGATC